VVFLTCMFLTQDTQDTQDRHMNQWLKWHPLSWVSRVPRTLSDLDTQLTVSR
jgi:hypothetical protein